MELPTIAPLLEAYERLVASQNESLGLVSPRTLPLFHEQLLLPCLALAQLPAVQNASSIADLGSGNGLPGIPVAIVHPGKSVLLVDSQLKRCHFLELVARELGLATVRVLHGRVEKVRDEPCPDIFICRFFKEPTRMAAYTRRWRKPGARYLVFAGEEAPAQARIYDLTLQERHTLGAGKVALEYLVG